MSFGRGRGRGAGTANVSNIPSAMQQQLQEPERATNDSQLTQAIPRSSGSFNRDGGTIRSRGGGRGGGGSLATGANAVNFQQPNLEASEQVSNSMRGGRGGARGGRSAGNFEDVRENARNDNDEFRAIGGTTHNDVAARIVPGAPTASTASRYVPPTRSLEDLYKEDNDHQNYYMEIPGGDMEVAISGPGVEKQLQFDEWTEMNLHPKLLENIVEHSKYMRPRKIQSRAIPYILEGYDIKALAETGSGKTGAFMIPIIQKILFAIGDTSNQQRLGGKPTPLVIIIEPTRELCLQVYDQGRKFANEIDVKVCKAYGQYNFGNNMGELRAGCHILCATTGRLKHLIGQHMIDVSKVSYFVLDEADEMLKNNFLDDVREIIENPEFPKKEQRQTMLFSATFPYEIQELANEVLRPNYVMAALVKYHSVSVNPRVRQQFVQVDNQHKADLLKELLEKEQKEAEEKNPADPNMRRTLVFVQTRRDADRLALYLCENNIKASTINGDRTQQERELALRDFRIGKVYVLVATDVCARGIDIKDLDHVINYDLPTTFIIYTHRIGRTGRVKLGDATSFVEMNKDGSLITEIIKTLREIGQPVPDFMTGGASNAKFPPTTGLPENGFGINALPTKDDFGFASKVVVADDFGFGREHLPASEFGSNTLAGVAFNDNANKPGISSSDEWGTTDHGWN